MNRNQNSVNNPFFEKHLSEETKKKISEAQKGENNHFFGKRHSEETKERISKSLKEKSSCGRPKKPNSLYNKYLRGECDKIDYDNALAKRWGFKNNSDFNKQIRLTVMKMIQEKIDWKPVYKIIPMQEKINIIEQYKNVKLKCNCCDEHHEEFLTIDHANNNGAEHRRNIGYNSSINFMLFRHGFRASDYQVLCLNCNMCKGFFRECYHKNQDINYSRESYYKARIIVLSHYSNGTMKCACCGEDIIFFLAIDHINGGGNKHRREINGQDIYSWLIKNNFPDGYQVLCHNCNYSLGHYGYCPHNPEIKREVKKNSRKSMKITEEIANETTIINNLDELLL